MIFILMSLISQPEWVEHLPESDSAIYAYGEAFYIKDKDDALHRAWTSALVKIGQAHFSMLTKVTSHSIEGLDRSSYDRRSSQDFEIINWEGLEEAKGSPVVTFNSDTKTYTAYRLFVWSKTDLETSKMRVKEELQKREQAKLVAQQEVKKSKDGWDELNERIDRHFYKAFPKD